MFLFLSFVMVVANSTEEAFIKFVCSPFSLIFPVYTCQHAAPYYELPFYSALLFLSLSPFIIAHIDPYLKLQKYIRLVCEITKGSYKNQKSTFFLSIVMILICADSLLWVAQFWRYWLYRCLLLVLLQSYNFCTCTNIKF